MVFTLAIAGSALFGVLYAFAVHKKKARVSTPLILSWS